MKAVLLSAGRGSRLGSEVLPKPLQEIGPRSHDDETPVTLLERQVLCLQAAGVARISAVVGWRKEQVIARMKPLGVTCIENEHPRLVESGTTHSIQFAACSSFDPFDGRDPTLVLDGDIVYEQALIDAVVSAEGPSALAVTPRVGNDPEEVRVYGDDQGLRLIGKGLSRPMIDGLELIGEATGIWRVAPRDHALLRAVLDWLVGKPGGSSGFGFAKVASEHEELAQYLINLRRLATIRLDPDLLFMEADFPHDLDRIREQIYPAILRRDARA